MVLSQKLCGTLSVVHVLWLHKHILSGVTILSILMGLASLAGIIHGYRPRNHVSYVIGFRKRTKSMIISLGVRHLN